MPRHTISIKEDTWQELQKYAEGFQTPDDALRRVLGLQPRSFNGNRPDIQQLWVLKTDADLEELATDICEGLEQRLGDEEYDKIEDRIVSNFGDQFIPSDSESENEEAFNRYTDMMLLGEVAVLQLVSEHLMSAYKQPGGGEDDGEKGTPPGRKDHPSSGLRSV
jgi:hypothetical protein